MRVLHVVVAGEVGGAEHMLASLLKHDRENEHAIALFTPSDVVASFFASKTGAIFDRGRLLEGTTAYLWRSFSPWDCAWLVETTRSFGPAVVHLHTFGSHVLGTRAAARASIAVLRTEHSTRVYDDPSCTPFSLWSLRRAKRAVAVSEHVCDRALRSAPWAREKMRVIRNGIDTSHFALLPPPDDATPTFAIVGRLERRKGIDLALQALARVPRVRLLVVGEGSERGALERLAREIGVTDRVEFVGYLRDARPILQRAHAVISSSREEGLGIALLEGMSSGRPVVGFSVGGVPEFAKDGSNALLTVDLSVGALAGVLAEASGRLSRLAELGEHARRSVVEGHSVDAMCAKYMDVYEDCSSRR